MKKREAWNQTWDVNVTGTQLFTETFAPLLLASKTQRARLLFITSGLSSVTEHANGSSSRYTLAPAGWPKPDTLFLAYRSSKSGLNMIAAEWARVMRNDGVKVFNVSPGFLDTQGWVMIELQPNEGRSVLWAQSTQLLGVNSVPTLLKVNLMSSLGPSRY